MASRAWPRSVTVEQLIGRPLRVLPPPGGGPEHVVEQRVDHHAGQQLAALHAVVDHRRVDALGGDRHREPGVAVEVVGGAVERVDHPADAARAGSGRALLAEDAVVGTGRQQRVDDELLGGPVDLGDHVGAARLGAHRRPLAVEPVEQQGGGPAPDLLGQLDARIGSARGRWRGHGAILAACTVSPCNGSSPSTPTPTIPRSPAPAPWPAGPTREPRSTWSSAPVATRAATTPTSTRPTSPRVRGDEAEAAAAGARPDQPREPGPARRRGRQHARAPGPAGRAHPRAATRRRGVVRSRPRCSSAAAT